MSTNNANLEILFRVLEGLRREILELDKAMHRSFFAFITASLVFVGIYSDTQIVKDDNVRGILLFGLAQILFLLVLFAEACLANQNVHAGYIRSLEKQINKNLGVPLLLWESKISRRFLLSPRGIFFWNSLLLYGFVFVSFLVLMGAALRKIDNWWLSAVIIVELLVSIGLALCAHREFNKVEDFGNEIFDSYKIEES